MGPPPKKEKLQWEIRERMKRWLLKKKKRKEWTYKYATREHQPRVKVISEDYVLSKAQTAFPNSGFLTKSDNYTNIRNTLHTSLLYKMYGNMQDYF